MSKFVLMILVNGDHICGYAISSNQEVVKINNPMILIPKPGKDGNPPDIMLTPWGLGLFKDSEISIDRNNIICGEDAVDELRDDYDAYLKRLDEAVKGFKNA